VGAMPGVDLGLQRVADCKQFAVLGPEVADDRSQSRPERVCVDPGLGRRLLGDEIVEDGGNLQSVGFDTLHDGRFSREWLWTAFSNKTGPSALQKSFQRCATKLGL